MSFVFSVILSIIISISIASISVIVGITIDKKLSDKKLDIIEKKNENEILKEEYNFIETNEEFDEMDLYSIDDYML